MSEVCWQETGASYQVSCSRDLGSVLLSLTSHSLFTSCWNRALWLLTASLRVMKPFTNLVSGRRKGDRKVRKDDEGTFTNLVRVEVIGRRKVEKKGGGDEALYEPS